MPSRPPYPLDLEPASVSRRHFLLGFAVLPILAACSTESDSLASASKGSARTNFVDSVGWVDIDGRTAVIAFTPFKLDAGQRQAVLDGRGVYPALPVRIPMVELRIELLPGSDVDALSVKASKVASSQITFWHFSNPPAVIKDNSGRWEDNPEMTFVDLDGDLRSGGWISGTCRGQKVATTAVGSDVFSWNLTYMLSLG